MAAPPKARKSLTSVRLLTIRKFRLTARAKGRHRWTILDTAMRHPVTLLVLGFALTAGLGGFIQDRQHEIEANRAEVDTTSIALNHMRQAISEFAARAILYGRADDEQNKAKLLQAVDEAWIKADSAIQDNSYAVAAAFPMPNGKIRDEIRDGFSKLRSFLRESNFTKLRDLPAVPAQGERSSEGRNFTAVRKMELCVNEFMMEYDDVLLYRTPKEKRLARLAADDPLIDASRLIRGVGDDCPRPLTANQRSILLLVCTES